jgi:predicted DNA-binding transcriptional regulator AlpA
VSPKDLVGVAEIAERAGVTPDGVHKWRKRHSETFPRPVVELSSGPVWDYSEVRRWIRSRSSKARTGTRSEHPSDAGEEKRPERS